MGISQLLLEACIVGLLNVIIGGLVSVMFMGLELSKSFEHWPSVLATYFIAGILIHLLCEFSGLNKKYCKSGNACLN
jgi:hypothetical protein